MSYSIKIVVKDGTVELDEAVAAAMIKHIPEGTFTINGHRDPLGHGSIGVTLNTLDGKWNSVSASWPGV